MGIEIKRSVRSFSRKQSGLFVFLRAQLSAQLATISDFLITLGVFYFLPMRYIYATFIGAVCGGILNCIVNYEWTFKADSLSKRGVALKYLMVWGGSIALNTWGTYYLTGWMHRGNLFNFLFGFLGEYRFMVAKGITAFWVACVWNYYLQAYFVYRPIGRKRNRDKEI